MWVLWCYDAEFHDYCFVIGVYTTDYDARQALEAHWDNANRHNDAWPRFKSDYNIRYATKDALL
jgi:hypothetical protein